jgi:hypothetical protein
MGEKMSELKIEKDDEHRFDKIYEFMNNAHARGNDVHIVTKEGTLTIEQSVLGEVKEWFLEGHMQDRVDKINRGEIKVDAKGLKNKRQKGD